VPQTDPSEGTRVTLVTSDLGAGGAERALVLLAGGLQDHGYVVTVISLRDRRPDFYSLDHRVRRGKFEPQAKRDIHWYDAVGQYRRLAAVRRGILATSPDVLISFQDGVNELILCACAGAPFMKLISCQNDMTQRSHINKRWEQVRRFSYRLADRVVFLDSAQAEAANRRYRGWRAAGIPNPIPLEQIDAGVTAQPEVSVTGLEGGYIAAMGRLHHQKGFDLLIQAFAKCVCNWAMHLVIIGEGPDRDKLEDLVTELTLSERVHFVGLLRNPFAVIARSRAFVFSSRYEGQGLALIEAMACGVPVISFDCLSGPGLVIEARRNGLLVEPENVDALASAITDVMENVESARSMAREARKTARRYATRNIVQHWVELIEEQLLWSQSRESGSRNRMRVD